MYSKMREIWLKAQRKEPEKKGIFEDEREEERQKQERERERWDN